MRAIILTSCALLALGGCKLHQAGEQASLTKAEATKIAESAEANFNTGDVKAVIGQYAEGAVMFDASHPAYSTDRKVQTGWAKDYVSMKPADLPGKHDQNKPPEPQPATKRSARRR